MMRHIELNSCIYFVGQVLKFGPGESGLQGLRVWEAAHHTRILQDQTNLILRSRKKKKINILLDKTAKECLTPLSVNKILHYLVFT